MITTSANNQDQFVLETFNYKRQGYFIDIGAADGVTASNTFTLEKWYNWHGICVDPNPVFLQSLQNCRDSHVSSLCVHSHSGQILPFKFMSEPEEFFGWNFRSGLTQHVGDVGDENINAKFKEINVYTISLNDLLELYSAPKDIDYLNIDAEGSEYSILSTFDFNRYNIKCITIECVDPDDRKNVLELLTKNNYTRVHSTLTHEDWYLKNE